MMNPDSSRRVAAPLLAALLVATLAACGDKPGPAMPAATPEAAPAAPAATPARGTGTTAAQPAALEPIPVKQMLAAVNATHGGGHCLLSAFDAPQVAADGTVRRSGTLKVLGWGANQQDAVSPGLTLVLRGAQVLGQRLNGGIERPDVVKTTKLPALARSGFEATLDLASVPAGDYDLLLMQASPAETFLCDFKRKLHVVD